MNSAQDGQPDAAPSGAAPGCAVVLPDTTSPWLSERQFWRVLGRVALARLGQWPR